MMDSETKNLLKTIAHEFRTPLNSINNTIYSINHDDAINGSVTSKLKTISEQTQYLSHLIEEITSAVLDKETNIEDKELINLNQVIKKCISAFSYNKNKNAIILNSKLEQDTFLISKKNVLYIINNIINNAVSYTTNGKINLVVKEDFSNENKTKIVLELTDSLEGTNYKEKNKIYSKELTNGKKHDIRLNLGMFLLEKNIKECGKESCIKITKNGVIVHLVLNSSATEKTKTAHKFTLKKGKILIVEDNKINQLLTRKYLETKGHECYIANHGLEALDEIKGNVFDAILMDIMMPVMDGYECAKEIKSQNIETPIIAFTAIPEFVEGDNKLLFIDTIKKPFAPQELFEILNKYILES